MKKLYILSALLFLFIIGLNAQTGKEFWFSAPLVTIDHNPPGGVPIYLRITTLDSAATVVVTQPANVGWVTLTQTIPANSSYSWDLSSLQTIIETAPTNSIRNTGLKIASTTRITAYYEVANSNNNEIYALKGPNALGTEFYIPLHNHAPFNNHTFTNKAYASFNIVATQNNTIVQIYPTKDVDGHPALTQFSITLNAGQTYSCAWTGANYTLPSTHPSGSVVISDKPIAITISDDSDHNPAGGCYDVTGDQIIPVDIAGTEYIVVRGSLDATGDESAFILATQNNTKVYINGGATPVTTLFAGETYRYNLTDPTVYITASKPVYCHHFTGFGCELGSAILPPLNCAGSSQVSFVRSSAEAFFLTILVKAGNQGNFVLNGSTTLLVAGDFAFVPGTGNAWVYTNKSFTTTEIPVGTANRLTNTSDVFSMGLINGGATSGCKYGYFSEYVAKIITNAGADQIVCANRNAILNGSVSGGASTGAWTCNGTGTFVPNNTTLNATYIPSLSDITNGSVDFTLTSTGICFPVTDQMHMSFTPAPTADAGSDQTRCSNNANVTLNGGVTISGGGQWSGGGGSFIPNNTTLTATYVPTSAEISAGTVTLVLTTIANGSCNPVTDDMVVTFTQGPIVSAGVDLTACANNPTVTLAGNISFAGGGIWSGGAGVFNPSNTTLNATYTATPGEIASGNVTLTLTSTNNGNCNPSTDNITIHFSSAPTANAGPDQTVCANRTIQLNGSVIGAIGGDWTGGLGLFLPNASTLNAIYTPTANEILNGEVNLTLTSTGNGTCNPVTDNIKIDFSPAPTANAGSDQTLCANNANVSLNGVVTIATGGRWTTSGNGYFLPNNNTLIATYIPSTSDLNLGRVKLFLTTTGNGSCFSVVDSINVFYTVAPVVNAGPDITVCPNNLNIPLNGSVSGGASSGIWTTTGTGTFFPSNTALNATYVASSQDSITLGATLTLTATNFGNCNPSSDQVRINIFPAGTANAGSDQTVCANNLVISLHGVVGGGAIGGVWSSSGTGTFSPNPQSLITTYIPSNGDIANGWVNLILTANSCNNASDQLHATITESPVANAGPDQTICVSNLAVQLNGLISGVSTTGTWVSGGTGYFTPNANTLNAIYHASAQDSLNGQVYLYLSSTNNGTCFPAIDTLSLHITPPGFVNAGPDNSVCSNNPDVPLNGIISGGASTGIWTTSGTGVFTPNNTTLTATYNSSAQDVVNGFVNLTLTATNSCNNVFDNIMITYTPGPTANAGPDQTVCGNNANTSLSGSYTVAGGIIWSTSGTGSFSPNPTVNNPTYIPSAEDITTGSVYLNLTTTGNGNCNASTDSLLLTISPAPLVDAGPNQIVCKSSMETKMLGSVSGGSSTGHWTTTGSGIFTNADDLNTTYTFSSADTSAGAISITLTSTNNGSCLPMTDNMTLTFSNSAFAFAGYDRTICTTNLNPQLNGFVSGGATTGIWSTMGTGYFSPSPTTLNAIYHFSQSDSLLGSVNLILTTTNTGSCLPGEDTTTISVEKLAIVNAGPDQTICSGINFVDISGQVTYGTGGRWTTTGTGSFANPNLLVTRYIPSNSDSIAGTVNLILTSRGNINCSPQKDTLKLTLTNVISPDFTYSAPCSGEEIAFNENCSVFSGDIVAYKWDFGGGQVFFTQNVSFTFATPGNHSVTLTVTSSLGCIYSITKVLFVSPKPFANFSSDGLCFKENVAFTDISSVTSGGVIFSWDWDFGDSYYSNERNPVHKYSHDGTFNVVLRVTTSSGCWDSIMRQVSVLPSPIADYSSSSGCVNDTIYFTDASTFPSGNISTCNWLWDFGGGAISTQRNPFKVWNVEGTFNVSLVVASPSGCTDTLITPITISRRPVAGFTIPDSSLVINEIINFTDSSLYSTSWMWDFGDNSDTSSRQNPSHVYFAPGVYSVTQTVFNGTCPASIIKLIVIKGIKEVYPPKVPTGFSPNNDGTNDVLYVRGGPFSSLQFVIYNKWGEKIFESNSPDIGWDGNREGKKEPVGVYLWTVKAVTIDGQVYSKSGEVTILR